MRPRGKPVEVHQVLGEAEQAAVRQAVLDHRPCDVGLSGQLWTRRLIGDLIAKLYRVQLTEPGVGKYLVSGSIDGTARLLDVATGKTSKSLTGHTDGLFSVAFSPDGRLIVTASVDRTIHLWDVATAKTRTTLTGHTDTVQSVAFSADGHTVATGSLDNTVRLWEVATGKTRTTLTTDHVVNAVAFSRFGHTLATAGGDKTVRLWNIVLPKPSEAIQKICRAVNRDLTQEERTAYLPGGSIGHVCLPQ